MFVAGNGHESVPQLKERTCWKLARDHRQINVHFLTMRPLKKKDKKQKRIDICVNVASLGDFFIDLLPGGFAHALNDPCVQIYTRRNPTNGVLLFNGKQFSEDRGKETQSNNRDR